MPNNKQTSSYLQGLTRLIVDTTIGLTNLVETMHKRIVHPPLLPSTPIQHLITHIAGISYKNIRWSTELIGKNLDKALGQLDSVLGEIKTTSEKKAIRSALNGVVGDYLEENKNPLKITMQFRYLSKPITLNHQNLGVIYPRINGKILLMVHGACMNDLQWRRKGHNHGEALAEELNKTPIYLHYNSGRHISTNGKDLSELLENLILTWPVAIEELVIVSHSMGGLVSRSAIHYGMQKHKTWTTYLKKIVFLGTPHHGAPLERTGNYLDVILESIPYAKPFARLGKVRSAGITDLRYGNLIDEDWSDKDRFQLQKDPRQPIPLPEHVDCYSIAAVIGKENKSLSHRIVGDSLVDLKSALGQHSNPSKNLAFKKNSTWIAFENNHLDLLNNPKVYCQIKAWLIS
ncbi:esterase/lipase family protein [Winogradskyella alexanderae]|uniref:GPI inositol-deacylase n=1 Tax=Winogradskyella alexanderae TaxID=2877123 RepID=A0ABS7XU41_9FLAO|nr:GPI inositol-deacylase [Winogradskyella alexanderae]MCA0133546.1 GPI inositol-deacylase [Winogradskyella alexanderae]